MPDRHALGLADDEERATPTAKLMIEEPRLSDEALYKCDVTYVKGKCPSISLVRVQMMALPEKAQIFLDSPTGRLGEPLDEGSLVGPYSEHEQLKLSCLVRGGRPAPKSIIWRKIEPSGRTINLAAAATRLRPAAGAEHQTSIEVALNHTLTSADLGARFECHIDHEAIETQRPAARATGPKSEPQPANSDALLDLHPAVRPPEEPSSSGGASSEPLMGALRSLDAHVYVDLNVGVASLDLFMAKVNKMNASEPLKEGDLVELECVALNSRPPANVSWFNGQEPIEQLEGQTTTTTVTLSPLSGASKTPALRLHKRLLQRNQIHQNTDGQTYNTHSFLSIKLSRHEHKAQITCQAQNSPMRQPATRSLELQVQHAPIVLMEPAAGITINEAGAGQLAPAQSSDTNNVINAQVQPTKPSNQVNIYCIYSANPIELIANSTRWFKDGHPLNLAQSDGELQQANTGAIDYDSAVTARQHLGESFTATGYPVLTINQVSRRDAGLYECQLANSIGASERLPASEACRLDVNFRPSVQLRLFKASNHQHGGPLASNNGSQYRMDELVEVDLSQELVLPGNSFVLVCDVLEAQPNKIHKYYWYKNGASPRVNSRRTTATTTTTIATTAGARLPAERLLQQSRHHQMRSNSNLNPKQQQQQQLIGQTEAGQFVLNSLPSDFAPSSYSCSASNALGPSDQSNQIDLQLSYSPGPSTVVPILDRITRKTILASGRPAHLTSAGDVEAPEESQLQQQQQPVVAASELLLECLTPDLGQPRANIWLWFKNGHSLEAPPFEPAQSTQAFASFPHNRTNNPMQPTLVNTITGHGQDSLASDSNSDPDGDIATNRGEENNSRTSPTTTNHQQLRPQPRTKLISSGRYLFIPSVQLAHKGNYSCVAVNRLGSFSKSPQISQPQQPTPANNRHESHYQLNVALAPSFVQPLPSQTYWQETNLAPIGDSKLSSPSASGRNSLELLCHVQCEPICQIEWLRNGEPLDIKRYSVDNNNGASGLDYVTYSMEQSIMAENEAANMFKSVESKLLLHFPSIHTSNINRDRILERRKVLSGSNYTCQSSSNSVGPAVRSTTKFSVQYPPEKVLINAPSDRLSLVEGSNGPHLSCEAFGQPHVQFRWLLVRANGGVGAQLMGSRLDVHRSQDQRLFGSSDGNDIEAIRSDNDVEIGGGVAGLEAIPQKPTDLTHASSEQAGVAPESYVSTLDLSGQSFDRRQSGQYICEASNRLGVTRQSVYVDVLYKPICATLHLHSLDMTVAPSLDNTDQNLSMDGTNQQAKPHKATSLDEYHIVRETSEDFIGLRKMLVLAPLLNRYTTHGTSMNFDGNSSVKDSIFHTILEERRANRFDDTGKDRSYTGTGRSSDETSDNHRHENLLMSLESGTHTSNLQPSESDNVNVNSNNSWDRFNDLLLRFLNNYMRQVKNADDSSSNRQSKDKRQNRRSDQSTVHSEETVSSTDSTKNLITFACVAQDGNPMNNLTFDWSIGPVNLPETAQSDSRSSDIPKLVYSNSNNTLNIFLVRRLDTKSSLNPFQMSLLTLNIVIATDPAAKKTIGLERTTRQSHKPSQSGRGSPAARNRYRSNSPKTSGNLQLEFETRPYNFDSVPVELTECNWQEKLGSLLVCTVGNQIGTSDSCPARVNMIERAKGQASSLEFARWRLPSFAHKSLLLISIVLGCILIIVITSTLLLSPYLKELNIARSETSTHSSKADSNTGQSTSSQKSSVLGLLGNGDSSLQGSSDDDSSARLNHMGPSGSNLDHQGKLTDLDGSNMMSRGPFQDHLHSLGHTNGLDYDRPRTAHERFTYHPSNLMNEDTVSTSAYGNHERIHQIRDYSTQNMGTESSQTKPTIPSAGSKLLSNLRQLSKFRVDKVSDFANFGSKKGTRDLHMKTVSNSETNTTGLCVSALESDLQMDITSPNSTGSPSFFRQSNVRQSHLGFSRQPSLGHQHGQINHRIDPAYNLLTDTRLSQFQAKNMTTGRRTNQSSAYSNMFEQSQQKPLDAMDEFMRRRGLDTSFDQSSDLLASNIGYRSHSVKHPHPFFGTPMHMQHTNNDLSHYYQRPNPPPAPPSKPKPFIHPRNQQNIAATMFRSTMDDVRPPVATRSFLHRHDIDLGGNLPCQTIDNRFSVPNYGQTFITNQVPMHKSAYLDTIDSHLNRMAGGSNIGQHLTYQQPQEQQITYANAAVASAQGYYDDFVRRQDQSTEHIYDVNAYATPEQTPLRRANASSNQDNNKQTINAQTLSTTTNESERPRVSQLIQTFDFKSPE